MPQLPKKPTTPPLKQPTAKRSALNLDIAVELAAAVKVLAPAALRLKKALTALDVKKMPVGALVDTFYALRMLRSMVPALAAPFDDIIGPAVKTIEDHFVDTLNVGESSGVQGMTSRVQINDHPVPIVKPEDWTKFWTYVAKTKQWDLLPRSVNAAAVRERWDDKKQVKFVGVFHAKKVSCTKLGGKK